MGDSKALPILGGVMLVLFLPLLIVLALIVGGLAGHGLRRGRLRAHRDRGQGVRLADRPARHRRRTGRGRRPGQSPHRGIDFDVDEGSKVYAAEDGKVVSTADNQIRIRHDEGVETRYKYFKDITVRVDQEVKRGDKIGTSGSGDEAEPGLRRRSPALRAVGREGGRRAARGGRPRSRRRHLRRRRHGGHGQLRLQHPGRVEQPAEGVQLLRLERVLQGAGRRDRRQHDPRVRRRAGPAAEHPARPRSPTRPTRSGARSAGASCSGPRPAR